MRHMAPWTNIQSKGNNRLKALEAGEDPLYSPFKKNKGVQGWNWEDIIWRDGRYKIPLLFPVAARARNFAGLHFKIYACVVSGLHLAT